MKKNKTKIYATCIALLAALSVLSSMIGIAQNQIMETTNTLSTMHWQYPSQLTEHQQTHPSYNPSPSMKDATQQKPQYITIDLAEATDPLGVEQCEAVGINNNGEVVGYEAINFSLYRSIYWARNGSATLLPNNPGDNSSRPFMIDDSGRILGWSALVTYEQHGGWTEVHENQTAVTWTDQVVANLNDEVTGGDTLDLYYAMDNNDAGQIVGSGAPPGHIPPPWYPNGFILEQGTVTDIGYATYPEAINNQGHIAGHIEWAFTHACVWEDGVFYNLNNHSSIHANYSQAFDINDNDNIVGFAQMNYSDPEEPIVWIDHEPIRILEPHTRIQGYAIAINEQDEVVGFYIDLDSPNPIWLSFLWKDGEVVILNDLLPPEQGWEDIYPADINDKGQIVGLGYRTDIGWRAFLMTPVSEPMTPTLSGPTEGTVGHSYEYSVVSTDPDDEDLYYLIDWGDNTTSEWLGPYVSGVQMNVQHTWNEKGIYTVKAKAKDMYGVESNWSDPIEMTISAPQLSIEIKGGFGITATIANLGDAPATNIAWSMSLDGGFILLGKETTGSIATLAAGDTVQIKSKLIVGIGKTTITIHAVCDERVETTESGDGTVILFFTLGVK
jgi:hypothetical protein